MPVQIDTTAENNALRLVNQGAHPATPSVNHTLLYVMTGTNSGLFIENDQGQKIGPFITGTPASSGISWTQVVNEDGTTFANFSGTAGTWSSNGTVIKQTNTAANESRARCNTLIVNSGGLIVEAEVQIQSGGTSRRAGLLVGWSGNGTGGGVANLAQSSNQILIENDGVANKLTVPLPISQAVWYTLRVVVYGTSISVYVNGTLYGTGSGAISNANASWIGLYTYQGEGWFRNIKAWTLSLPA